MQERHALQCNRSGKQVDRGQFAQYQDVSAAFGQLSSVLSAAYTRQLWLRECTPVNCSLVNSMLSDIVHAWYSLFKNLLLIAVAICQGLPSDLHNLRANPRHPDKHMMDTAHCS